MPAVSMSAMKQDTSDDADAAASVHRQFASPAPLCQPQDQCVVDHLQAPLRDVMLSRDWTSGVPMTSQSADATAPPPPSKLVNSGAASSSALVSSPETGWRAISGSGVVGGSWDRKPMALQTSQSSPADAERADVSLVAASPTVGRTPRLTTSDSCDPLATLMRLYGGTLSDAAGPASSSPDPQLQQLDKQASSYRQHYVQYWPLANFREKSPLPTSTLVTICILLYLVAKCAVAIGPNHVT